MRHFHHLASLFVASLAVTGCGGGETASDDLGGGVGPLTLTTGPLVEGATWQLNRPIDIALSRPIDFGSVDRGNCVVQRVDSGEAAPGTYILALDPGTGEPDPAVIRFQPSCPVDPSEAPGFLPNGTEYMLTVRGADTTFDPLVALDGTELDETLEVRFSTPFGTDPSVLFFDTVPGPPQLVFRRRPGVTQDELRATRFEIGHYEPDKVYLTDDGLGSLAVDPLSQYLVPFGLPLNHYVRWNHRLALIAEFDQPIAIGGGNLDRVRLEYESGGWRRLPCTVEALAVCGPRGSTVRVWPLGTLPPGAALRIRLDTGFLDLVGEAHLAPETTELPLTGTTNQDAAGARVDALFEPFVVGGDEPGSMEDLTSDLGAPRGHWGGGRIYGIETPGGLSRVRSKWYPVGLAGVDGQGTPAAP